MQLSKLPVVVNSSEPFWKAAGYAIKIKIAPKEKVRLVMSHASKASIAAALNVFNLPGAGSSKVG